jgi:hypothetical protein
MTGSNGFALTTSQSYSSLSVCPTNSHLLSCLSPTSSIMPWGYEGKTPRICIDWLISFTSIYNQQSHLDVKKPEDGRGMYCHDLCVWLTTGYGLVDGFIDHLYTSLGTTSNYSATAYLLNSKKLNSVALVRKRTIPTERPPLSAK